MADAYGCSDGRCLIACGVFVSNVYYNQPLLELLQQAFSQERGLINLAPTATQLGFACGLFFLVPLGDRIDRRKLILGQAVVLLVGLVLPGVWVGGMRYACFEGH